MSQTRLEQAAAKWGEHPARWTTPPQQMPRWWQSKTRLRELEAVFGTLSQEWLDCYWREVRKGQSVYEDAGGYILRCYRAMLGLRVEEPYTYEAAAADLFTKSAS